MKKKLSLFLCTTTLLSTLSGCSSPVKEPVGNVLSSSSATSVYADWLEDRLTDDGRLTGDTEIIIGNSDTAQSYGVDVSTLSDEGFIIRRTAGEDATLIFANTNDGVDRGVRYFANNCTDEGELNVVEGEGYRVGSITIAGANLSEYVIVCPFDADECQKFAADELRRFLGDACGVYPEIVTESDGYAITLVRDVTGETYGDESFSIKSHEKGITITGGKYRGCMYGVYEFLEQYIGYRFYYRNAGVMGDADRADAYLYENESIDIPADLIDLTVEPSITVRDTFDYSVTVSQALKYNGQYYDGNKKLGGYGRITKACHGHQVYISDYELERLGFEGGYNRGVNPCFMDEELTDLLIEKVLIDLSYQKNGGAVLGRDFTTVDISQRDIPSFCMCDTCLDVIREDGAVSGTIVRHANAVAEAIEPEYPEITVAILAYYGTSVPPKKTIPHENVQVSFCFYISDDKKTRICGNHPINGTECETNKYFSELYDGWAAITDNIYVWYYPSSAYFNAYSSTYTNNIYHDIKYLADTNAYGIFYLGDPATCSAGLINWYMAQRMMWNSDITEEEYHEMLKEYLWLTYGDGYEFVYEFIQIMEEASDRTDHCFCGFFDSFEDKLDMSYIEENLDLIFTLRETAIRLARTTEQEVLIDRLFSTIYYYEIAVLHDEMWVNGDESSREEYKSKVNSYITNYSWLPIGDNPCTPTVDAVDYNVNPYDWVTR